jgi:PAP2 superfamily
VYFIGFGRNVGTRLAARSHGGTGRLRDGDKLARPDLLLGCAVDLCGPGRGDRSDAALSSPDVALTLEPSAEHEFLQTSRALREFVRSLEDPAMMLTVPILVLALLGQAPLTPAPADEHTHPAEQGQSVDDSAADANGAADPAQSPAPTPTPQKKADSKEPPTPEHTGIHALFGNLLEDLQHLPSMQNVYIAAGGGAMALAVHPADVSVNTYMVDHYSQFNAFFAAGKYIGNTPEQVAGAIATYAYGRIFDEPKVSHFGMDLLQAQILTEILVEPLKFATQRERPDGSNHLSFPSGHSSITFATATVIERHLGWRKALLAYAIASYVATSRLHDDQHWLSDVVFGAAVGTIAGRTVVHHAADYWALTPVKVPGGAAILVTRTAQR